MNHAVSVNLNEVLSIRAQELAWVFASCWFALDLNEVLSIRAQEFALHDGFHHAGDTSMKS